LVEPTRRAGLCIFCQNGSFWWLCGNSTDKEAGEYYPEGVEIRPPQQIDHPSIFPHFFFYSTWFFCLTYL
jgi:hypothetical protein